MNVNQGLMHRFDNVRMSPLLVLPSFSGREARENACDWDSGVFSSALKTQSLHPSMGGGIVARKELTLTSNIESKKKY